MKKILIIGASSDLGFPISRSLAEQGHKLCLHYHSQSDKIRSLQSEKVNLMQADIRNDEEVSLLISNAVKEMNGIDILINMIGPYFEKDLLELKADEWRHIIELNLNVVFSVVSSVHPYLQQSKGHIVNFCYDGVETIRSWKKATAYAAAKSGLAVLTKSLASRLAPFGVRVNAICPGYMDLELFSKEKKEEIVSKIPQGRLGHPQELVSLLNWLIHESPTYMTGALIPIGGAWEHET